MTCSKGMTDRIAALPVSRQNARHAFLRDEHAFASWEMHAHLAGDEQEARQLLPTPDEGE